MFILMEQNLMKKTYTMQPQTIFTFDADIDKRNAIQAVIHSCIPLTM